MYNNTQHDDKNKLPIVLKTDEKKAREKKYFLETKDTWRQLPFKLKEGMEIKTRVYLNLKLNKLITMIGSA